MSKDRIEFGNLTVGVNAYKNVNDCLNRNWVSMGDKVKAFENGFADLFNYKHAVAVSSGTDADINAYLTLYEFGAQLGDEVIVPSLAFIANATSVLAAGLRPVFCEIKKNTLNIDEDLVESLITPKTRAICAVSTMGKPPNMARLREIADKHNLILICDNCEGHGCQYSGKYMGEWADMSTYSGYIAHLIISCEFGFVTTNRDDLNEILRSTRSHGREAGKKEFNHVRLGYNSKPTDLHASVGLDQLPNFWNNVAKRNVIKSRIREGLRGTEEYFLFSEQDENEVCSPHAFSITLRDPKLNFKKFRQHLEDAGIETKLNFMAASQHPVFQKLLSLRVGDYPEAEYVGNNGLHFGCHADLTLDDADYVVETVRSYLK